MTIAIKSVETQTTEYVRNNLKNFTIYSEPVTDKPPVDAIAGGSTFEEVSNRTPPTPSYRSWLA